MKQEPWTRAHKLQIAALFVAVVGVIAGYCYFHFKASGQPQSSTQMNGANGNVNQGGTQINNGGNGAVINNSPGAIFNQVTPNFEPIPDTVASNIVKALRETPHGPTAVLVCPINPDESEYALSEQIKKIFWDGGYAIADGAPPNDLQEIPGVSLFLIGAIIPNAGLGNAMAIILGATKSHGQLISIPGRMDNLKASLQFASKDLSAMDAIRRFSGTNHDGPDAVLIIMLRRR